MTRSLALAPLSYLYGAAVRARLALYRRGVLKSERVDAPVISVGNITAGGTGKTPLVGWLARAVAREGRRVCVLTRGYGREREGERVVVSDGEHLLADVSRGGDEPRLLAEQLLGAASVVSDANRAAAARWAVENLGAEVFILDDGFQHMQLARDLDVVTLDATAPWGGGQLLPRGLLREPPQGLARADCVVITHADMIEDSAAIHSEVARLSNALILEANVKTTHIRPLDSEVNLGLSSEVDLRFGQPATLPAAAFCATGNPRAFFEHLRRDGYELKHTRAFRDHHVFSQTELDSLCRDAGVSGARSLLTTAKDAVKLRPLKPKLPVFIVEIELVIEGEDRLLSLLRKTLARDRSESGQTAGG